MKGNFRGDFNATTSFENGKLKVRLAMKKFNKWLMHLYITHVFILAFLEYPINWDIILVYQILWLHLK